MSSSRDAIQISSPPRMASTIGVAEGTPSSGIVANACATSSLYPSARTRRAVASRQPVSQRAALEAPSAARV